MGFFGWANDDDEQDDGPMFGAGERHEKRQKQKEKAKEIASGLSMGKFEDDEEVWDLVKKYKEKDK